MDSYVRIPLFIHRTASVRRNELSFMSRVISKDRRNVNRFFSVGISVVRSSFVIYTCRSSMTVSFENSVENIRFPQSKFPPRLANRHWAKALKVAVLDPFFRSETVLDNAIALLTSFGRHSR